MGKVLLAASACLIACSLALTTPGQVAQSDLAAVLLQAANRRQEYVDTFKDLTAVETKTTELFDKSGKIEKQRKVVSDLLIYKLQTNSAVMDEFRVTREVDGKIVGQGERRAIELLTNLAKSKNFERERKQLRDENLKYTLKYYRWGITLQPVPAVIKEMQTAYRFSFGQSELINDREMLVLNYQSKGDSPLSSNLVMSFTNPRIGDRGKIWLDAEDFRVWRWISEKTVVDKDITSPAVYMRDEIEYVPSVFGILVPKTVITTFFDKQDTDRLSVRLTGKITYTYDAFKRYGVSADSEVQKIRN
jgi:uncharacterized protein YihD (DUF1040 family)